MYCFGVTEKNKWDQVRWRPSVVSAKDGHPLSYVLCRDLGETKYMFMSCQQNSRDSPIIKTPSRCKMWEVQVQSSTGERDVAASSVYGVSCLQAGLEEKTRTGVLRYVCLSYKTNQQDALSVCIYSTIFVQLYMFRASISFIIIISS